MTDTIAPFDVTFVRRRVSARGLVNGRLRTTYPEYQIWSGMISRCYNPNSAAYRHYGGRGITVCDSWRSDFAAFYADMGDRPSLKHSIDRVDNNRGYSPDNCRWATPAEQSLNRRPVKGTRSDTWTAEDDATLTKMWGEYHAVEAIATVLGRTIGSTRLHVFHLGLHRDASYTKLSKKHADLAPILQQRGPEAFLTALKEKIAGQNAEKARKKRAKEASRSEVVNRIMAGQDDRNAKMRALRLAGCDLSAIGRLFGITRERVRQIQLTDFRAPGEQTRKVSATQPHNRARHVDRLVMAWNKASVDARLTFLELASADPRADLPRLMRELRTAPKPHQKRAA